MKGKKKWLAIGALLAVTLGEALASIGVLPPVVGPVLRAAVEALGPPVAM